MKALKRIESSKKEIKKVDLSRLKDEGMNVDKEVPYHWTVKDLTVDKEIVDNNLISTGYIISDNTGVVHTDPGFITNCTFSDGTLADYSVDYTVSYTNDISTGWSNCCVDKPNNGGDSFTTNVISGSQEPNANGDVYLTDGISASVRYESTNYSDVPYSYSQSQSTISPSSSSAEDHAAYSMCSCCGQNLEIGECAHVNGKQQEELYLSLYDKGMISKETVLKKFDIDENEVKAAGIVLDSQDYLLLYEKGLLSREVVLKAFDIDVEDTKITPRKVSEEREALIAQALEESQNRDSTLAKAMVAPILGVRGFADLGRKLLQVDELPQGAYARYDKDETEVASVKPPVNYDDVKELAIKQKATCIRPLCLNSISTLISDVESFIEDKDGSVDYLVVDQMVYNKMCENKLIGKETVGDSKEIAEGHVTDIFNAKLIVIKDNRWMMTAISTSKDTHMTIGFSNLKPIN